MYFPVSSSPNTAFLTFLMEETIAGGPTLVTTRGAFLFRHTNLIRLDEFNGATTLPNLCCRVWSAKRAPDTSPRRTLPESSQIWPCHHLHLYPLQSQPFSF